MSTAEYQSLLNGDMIDLTERAKITAQNLKELHSLNEYSVDETKLGSCYGITKLQNVAEQTNHEEMQLGE